MLKKTSNYPIGLDISDLSLKAVQLNKKRDIITIQAFNKISLEKGLIENGEIKNQEQIVKMIKTLLGKPKFGHFTSTEVVACLPEPKTFIKLLEIDKTPNKLEDLIVAELNKHIPVEIDKMYYDWQIIKTYSDTQLVLVGASPKYLVKQYLNALKKFRLLPLALEIEAQAISRALLVEENPGYKLAKNKKYGIIDIGAKRSSMFVYAGGTILFNVSMPISGEEITQKIAKTLEIDEKQAELAKIICGLDESKAQGIIKNILADMIKNLIERIKQVLEFYESHFPNYGNLDEILLCGGGASIKGLDKILAEKLSLKVNLGDAFKNINKTNENLKNFNEQHKLNTSALKNKKGKTISLKQDSSLSYATAIGLALRGIFEN